ncbi:mannitol dehydrogenase family protein [Kineosporia sp. A_224]|uniref:mannitol dehydrogenase family protein n=1 Tax=Kineosporia sp. A_224 TaxID=1962180 RepID=UPI000B4AB3CB|nr:mannitol dehydrogenase family protein [Kineosporia sp. A_224]
MTRAPRWTGYDRSRLRPTVVHIGPGVFHRAHQAVYCDTVLRTGERVGAVHGISLRSSGARDALAPNGFVYHVIERGAAERVRAVGSVLGIDVAPEDVGAALAALTDPAVTVVTVTVTEHGYCAVAPGGPLDVDRPEVRQDLVTPSAPRSLPGLLVEALRLRRAAGTPPFTVASCDNLPGNGRAVGRVVADLAECLDARLAEWVRGSVAFPSSMVDRMVPATTDADRARLAASGVQDAWPVVTEPFSQWVLEDVFPTGRPRWELAGVELVADVTPYEHAKLRVLNAAHSAFAYWGLLAGHRFVAQAAQDPALLAAVRDLLAHEVVPTLECPPGWDLASYAEDVLRRFSNAALPYTTAKVAGDGSQKLAVRVLPTVRARLAAGLAAPGCARLLAAWVVCLAGPRAPGLGVADAALRAAGHPPAGSGGPDAASDRLLTLPGLLDPAEPRERAYLAHVREAVRALWDVAPAQAATAPAPSTVEGR